MDPSRFDAFTLACEAALSRRHAMAALLASLPVALSVSRDAESKPKNSRRKRRRRKDKDKGKGKGRNNKRNKKQPCYSGTSCTPGAGQDTSGCNFSRSTLFVDLDAQGADLSNSSFAAADLRGADFRGASLRGGCFVAANLLGATIDASVNLTDAVFCQTVMPDGSIDDSGCDSHTACCSTGTSGSPPGSSPCGAPWELQTTFGSRGSGPDQFLRSTGVAVSPDGQTLWVADIDNHRIAVWTKAGNGWQAQTTFGSRGSGANQFNGPRSLAVSADGQTVWVADSRNDRISVWAKTGDTWTNQTTFGSRGFGPDQFRNPYGVAVSADGQTLWVANDESHVISVWTKVGGSWQPQTTFGGYGNGPSQFSSPYGVAVAADEQTVWVVDTGNNRISVWAKQGDTWTNQATFGHCCFEPDEFGGPSGVAVAADGQTVWVADEGNDRISIWTKTRGGWQLQATIGSKLFQRDIFDHPNGVAISPDGKTIWVADTENFRIAVWTKTGGAWRPQTTFGSFGSGDDRLDHPFGVTAAADGKTVWVADTINDRMAVWTRSGAGWQPQATFGSGGDRSNRFDFPTGAAVSDDGQTAWVADRRNSRIAVWTKATGIWQFQTSFGKPGSGPNEFFHPSGVSITGNGQTVWVADTDNARIAVWSRSGDTWTPQFTFGGRGSGPGQLLDPGAVEAWPDEQTVWVADTGNHRMAVWVKDGSTWRAIEFGSEGSGADQFRGPSGVAASPDGQTIWVADRGNHRVAVWGQAGIHSWTPRFTFGSEGSGSDQFRDPSGVAVSADEKIAWIADRGNNRISVWSVACPNS